MKVVVNGQSHEVNAELLAGLLDELGFADVSIATAVNGSFVAAVNRADFALSHGDAIEVLAPMQGG